MSRSDRLKAALAGAVAAAMIGGAAIAAVFEFGLFDVSASSAHLPEIRWFVHHTMVHSVAQRAGGHVPSSVPAGVAAAGLCEYREHCQTCHGGPAVARGEWANGLNPPPPYLIDARTRWSASELHWIVSNGVKMTAMPAWKASMNDRQIWSLVAFLTTLPDLPAAAYKRWAAAGTCPSGAEFAAVLRMAPSMPPGLPPPSSSRWERAPTVPSAPCPNCGGQRSPDSGRVDRTTPS